MPGNCLVRDPAQAASADAVILLGHLAAQIIKHLLHTVLQPLHLFLQFPGFFVSAAVKQQPHAGNGKLCLMDPGFHILPEGIVFPLAGEDLIVHRFGHLPERIIEHLSLQKLRLPKHLRQQILFLQTGQPLLKLPVELFFPIPADPQTKRRTQNSQDQNADHQLPGALKQPQHRLHCQKDPRCCGNLQTVVLDIVFSSHIRIYPCFLLVWITPENPASCRRFLRRFTLTVSVLSSTKSLQSHR